MAPACPQSHYNRLTEPGYAYDLSGNMTNDGLNTMTYNGESRVATSAQAGTTTTYTYNGSGLRVTKQVGSATPTVYIFSGTKVIAEYASGAAPGSPTREYVYSGSQLLATIESGTTKYHISDHLSLRVTTDSSGAKVADSGHYPFGENWYETGGVNKLKFTSYERDSESSNDYAMMRTSINRLGRFSSPDPLLGLPIDPQSLNRYGYTRDDAINKVDPTGQDWFSYWMDPSHQIGARFLIDLQQFTDREFWGERYYDLPGNENPLAQAELQFDRMVSLEFLKKGLKDLFKRNRECADMVGGLARALLLVNRLQLSDVSSPSFAPANALERQLAPEVAAGTDVAAVVYGTTYGRGRAARLFARWDRQSFRVLYAGSFASLLFPEQLTVAIHELMHVAWAGTPRQSMVDARLPDGTMLSVQQIVRVCDTATPSVSVQ